MEVQLAYRCALMLRDLIEPFLLRRMKKDVKEVSRMPGKTEHVLFCRLTQRQRDMYEAYLRSDEVARILRGNAQLFSAVTMLRKICNHPDLVCDPDEASLQSFLKNGQVNHFVDDEEECLDDNDIPSDEESLMERSGKLEVLSKILPLWHRQGHKVLVFCQWRKMLNILQRFFLLKGWKFGRLDGNTNIAARQRLVDSFNSDDSYFGMLCTTRTGGVGLNLTGANRIILYGKSVIPDLCDSVLAVFLVLIMFLLFIDPDWNPQTDAQARERAWRFGQDREVTIYRLITAGTIEEKIYQRQIFKTALSNKILQDPRQRRLFSQRDLRDLFTLSADTGSVRSGANGLTETSKATKGIGVVDKDVDVAEGSSDDNETTLRKVMQSKGLAGIFDHHSVEPDPLRKSTTVKEMEVQARQVAREAANALRQSTANRDPFAPTWTGSDETNPSRFGPSSRGVAGLKRSSSLVASSRSTSAMSSNCLLASLRQRTAEVECGGTSGPPSDQTLNYAKLLSHVEEFVRNNAPTTDDILKEFESVPDSEMAIFRRLLKSIATVDAGRWYLRQS
jgi:DNA excision repair protein ERCC-6